jgi:anti-sigma factor RsiW
MMAYIDNRLDPARRLVVEAALAADPAMAARVERDRVLRDNLRGALAASAQAEVPPHLRLTAVEARRRAAWRRTAGQAAAAVLLLVSGGAGGFLLGRHEPRAPIPVLAVAADATAAYRVFAVEKLHPVEVSANNENHLLQWLSNRLARRIVAPDLATLGFRLIGGRLLAGTSPGAQLMYEDGAGRRIALFVGAGGPEETAFRIIEDRQIATVAWVDHGFGFALTGPLGRDQALEAARLIYRAFTS